MASNAPSSPKPPSSPQQPPKIEPYPQTIFVSEKKGLDSPKNG